MNLLSVSFDSAYLLLVVGAFFVHICYQLSVSVLTHMSSHSLSRQTSTRRLLWLGSHYSLGVIVMTTLLLTGVTALAYSSWSSFAVSENPVFWSIVAVGVPVVGLVTATLYYRAGPGTQLWLPRPIAAYLLERSKKTRSGTEAFALGAMTVVGEVPFLVAPLVLIAVAVSALSPADWWWVSLTYAGLVSLPLVFTTLFVTSGHSIARLQKWREDNKTFLQWTSGIMLVALTAYLFVVHLGGGL